MLQKTFMTAEQLRLQPKHYDALCEVLFMLESGKIAFHRDTKEGKRFHMNFWHSLTWDSIDIKEYNECGTVGCIGGWAEYILAEQENVVFTGAQFFNSVNYPRNDYVELDDLFYPGMTQGCTDWDYDEITVVQAAQGLRNYLTTGSAKWTEILT